MSYRHRWSTWHESGFLVLVPPLLCTLPDISGNGLVQNFVHWQWSLGDRLLKTKGNTVNVLFMGPTKLFSKLNWLLAKPYIISYSYYVSQAFYFSQAIYNDTPHSLVFHKTMASYFVGVAARCNSCFRPLFDNCQWHGSDINQHKHKKSF